MMQTIQGKRVYVVEFDTIPELPITGLTEEEARNSWYEKIVDFITGTYQGERLRRTPTSTGIYAEALQAAIETGVITEPGKYGIHVDLKTKQWNIFKIIED